MKKLNVFVFGFLSFVAVVVVYTVMVVPEAKLVPENFSTLTPTKKIEHFVLSDFDEKMVSESVFKDEWHVLFFGFIDCPDVCPTTLSVLQQMYDEAEKRADIKVPKVWFVSIDPSRTDAERLKKYLNNFHVDFRGLFGQGEQLELLTKQLGIKYVEGHPGHIEINHPSTLFIVNPQGALHALVHLPYNSASLIEGFEALETNWSL